LKFQLLSTTEENMSRTGENFVRGIDKNNNRKFITTLRISI
jgi:hypothetical protein